VSGGARDNPFCAARFSPGALPWLGPAGELEALADRAFSRGTAHQLLGPHGSGKSTLLAHLVRVAAARGLRVARVRGGRRPLALVRSLSAEVLLIDEAEAIGPLLRPLVHLARTAGAAVVVAVHHDHGWPTLRRCAVDAPLAAAVVAHLGGGPVAAAGLEARLLHHAGNLREVLFELYDAHEAAERGSSPAAASAPSRGGAPPSASAAPTSSFAASRPASSRCSC
jgi:hypothetical protein